jgi:hypothetical protein
MSKGVIKESIYIYIKMDKKLLSLFNNIFNLSQQYQIKDIYTPVTIEKLEHDYNLEDKIEKYVKKLGKAIEKANTEINPNFIKMYEILNVNKL